MNQEIRRKIIQIGNCSLGKINMKVENDQDFINQLSYKYNIRIFQNDKIILKSQYTHKKAIPLDLVLIDNIIMKKNNNSFIKQYGTRQSDKIIEGSEEVKKILSLTANQNGSAITLLRHFLYNEFNLKMTLEELSESEKIMYSANYCYGQVNYLRNTKPITKAYSYDINSEHPYMLCHEDLLLPMRKGKEYLIDDVKDIDVNKVGLYLVNIEFNSHTKYFKPKTSKDFYTVSNYFIKILIETNTKFTMYKNEALTFNAITYENDDCINLKAHIGYEITKLFERKQNGSKLSQKIVQLLLGVFSTKYNKGIPVESKEEALMYNSCWKTTPNLTFRFKNFIYDFCRINLYNKYIKYCRENDIKIYRIKADSLHLSSKLPSELVDDKAFGFVKYEGKYTLEKGFKHVNDTSYKAFIKK